jgi:hypothetical protein
MASRRMDAKEEGVAGPILRDAASRLLRMRLARQANQPRGCAPDDSPREASEVVIPGHRKAMSPE